MKIAPGAKSRVRFTSNVVGFLFLLTDVACFIVSAPITLFAYSLLRGSRAGSSGPYYRLHPDARQLPADPTSRQAYRRSLLDLRDSSDTTFDAVISSLIATALIWQAGLVDDYSRGITLLFLLSVVLCLSVSRPALIA